MKELYTAIHTASKGRGLFGLFRLRLSVEPQSIPVEDVVSAAMRQRFARNPESYTEYAWGRIALFPRSSVIDIPPTRIYSPFFLGAVFGWNTDLPLDDGLICQVDPPDGYVVDRVSSPVGLAWTNESAQVVRRRARTAAGLFSTAVDQIPPGEVGAIYICYQDGDREEIADDRTRFLRDQMQAWEHSSRIRVGLTVMSRIVPRPLNHGQPDMVETAMPFISELTGGSVWLDYLPTLLFTE